MKISIDEKLEEISKRDSEKFNSDPVNEVKTLLLEGSTEDARILRNLSAKSQFTRIENIRGGQIQLEKLQESYLGKVYTGEQIKSLAMDYHLRFLPASYYTGSFDVEVAAKIKAFGKETNSPIDDYSLSRRYYILAPHQMFELKDKKHIYKKLLDPAIFFQIDKDHYRLIHKWGNDFSILRYLDGFRWKGYFHHWLFNTVICMPIVGFILTLLFGMADNTAAIIGNHPYLYFLSIFGISVIFSYFRWNFDKTDGGDIIDGFFSYSNWNSEERIHS